MRESAVESHFIKQVRLAGGSTRKCVFPGHRGAPDRIALWPGALHWVELKRPLTPDAEAHQLREHERLRRAGQTVLILISKPEVDEYIRTRSVER